VATAAGLRRNILGIQGRAGALRVHDQVLAVAVDANRSVAHSVFDRFAVDTLVELAGDFLVALRAGLRHIPVIDFGARIGCGIDVMTAVATGAGCRFLAERDGARVHALLIGIDGMRHRNLVPRQKARIAVTLGASIRHVLAGNGRVGFAGSLYGVDGSVAGYAFGRVGVAVFAACPWMLDARAVTSSA
jgi:hypothetical protein